MAQSIANGDPAQFAITPEILRAVADLLEANPGLPEPSVSYDGTVRWFTCRTAEEVAKVLRAVPGRWAKNDPNASGYDSDTATFTTTLLGHTLQICATRDQVCTRKVVGTREVVKTVPVTTEEVTVMEDVVEWECHSILAPVNA